MSVWAHGVNDPLAWQPTGGGRHRLADRKPVRVAPGPEPSALIENLRTSSAVDRAIHPATAQEGRIRCIDNGVERLDGDVALDGLDPGSHDGHCGTTAGGGARGGGAMLAIGVIAILLAHRLDAPGE